MLSPVEPVGYAEQADCSICTVSWLRATSNSNLFSRFHVLNIHLFAFMHYPSVLESIAEIFFNNKNGPRLDSLYQIEFIKFNRCDITGHQHQPVVRMPRRPLETDIGIFRFPEVRKFQNNTFENFYV